jgi:RNA polymerase sigma-70 factor (ECF subfamily)
LEEAELLGAARSGDRQAFDELVRRTFVDTFTLARRLTGNEEDARDVVQDAYLRAWKAIGKFRGDSAFSTWMYRITANTASTHIHKRRRQRAEPFGDDFEPADDRAERQVSQAAESAEALERISAALDELPAKLRSVVVLKDVYDLPHEQIAEELGISVAAAKVRLHRARRKLRDVLYDEGEAEAHAV